MSLCSAHVLAELGEADGWVALRLSTKQIRKWPAVFSQHRPRRRGAVVSTGDTTHD
jgi:hypothetical protein